MKLLKAIRGDMWFQFRYGFYAIYAVLCVIYIAIIGALPASGKSQVTAILIYSDPAAMGLFFMGAMILLEKSQRVLGAVAVSPLKHSQYILSKMVSLSVISVLVALIITLATGCGNILWVVVGTLFSSMIFTLLGIIAATRIQSLNQFMLISILIDVICFVPPILAVINPAWRLLSLFPFDSAMRLIYGSSTNYLLDIGINLIVIGLLFLIGLGQVGKMFSRVGGVKL